MSPTLHLSRQAAAQAETRETLVDLLVAHIDRAYTTAGQPGALEAARELFRHMSPTALTDLIQELDLEAEPVKEDVGTEPRRG